MPERPFAEQLRDENAHLWRTLLDHPFLQGLAEGSLPGDRFEHYLKQDRIYLVELSRVLALAAARAETIEEIELFTGLLHGTVTGELRSLERTASELGLTAEMLREVEPSLVTQAYCDRLVRVGHEGAAGDLVAALLPCQVSYPAIADRWVSLAQSTRAPYRAWLAGCGSSAMRELAARFAGLMNAHAGRADDRGRDRWRRCYRSSLRFELLFLQAAWEKMSWPACVAADCTP